MILKELLNLRISRRGQKSIIGDSGLLDIKHFHIWISNQDVAVNAPALAVTNVKSSGLCPFQFLADEFRNHIEFLDLEFVDQFPCWMSTGTIFFFFKYTTWPLKGSLDDVADLCHTPKSLLSCAMISLKWWFSGLVYRFPGSLLSFWWLYEVKSIFIVIHIIGLLNPLSPMGCGELFHYTWNFSVTQYFLSDQRWMLQNCARVSESPAEECDRF